MLFRSRACLPPYRSPPPAPSSGACRHPWPPPRPPTLAPSLPFPQHAEHSPSSTPFLTENMHRHLVLPDPNRRCWLSHLAGPARPDYPSSASRPRRRPPLCALASSPLPRPARGLALLTRRARTARARGTLVGRDASLGRTRSCSGWPTSGWRPGPTLPGYSPWCSTGSMCSGSTLHRGRDWVPHRRRRCL